MFGGDMRRRYLVIAALLAAIPAAVMSMWSVYSNLTHYDHGLGFSLLIAIADMPGLLGFFLPAAALGAWLLLDSSSEMPSRVNVIIVVGVATLLLSGIVSPWATHLAIYHIYLPVIGPTNPPTSHNPANDVVRLALWAMDSTRPEESARMWASVLRPVMLASVASLLAAVGSFIPGGTARSARREYAFVGFSIAATYALFLTPWLTRSPNTIFGEFLPALPATCLLLSILWGPRNTWANG